MEGWVRIIVERKRLNALKYLFDVIYIDRSNSTLSPVLSRERSERRHVERASTPATPGGDGWASARTVSSITAYAVSPIKQLHSHPSIHPLARGTQTNPLVPSPFPSRFLAPLPLFPTRVHPPARRIPRLSARLKSARVAPAIQQRRVRDWSRVISLESLSLSLSKLVEFLYQSFVISFSLSLSLIFPTVSFPFLFFFFLTRSTSTVQFPKWRLPFTRGNLLRRWDPWLKGIERNTKQV